MTKKNYDVALPVTGTVWVTVEAESEEDAIERAFESDDVTVDNLEEWEVHKTICEGNVLHASQNKAFAQLAFGEEP